MANDTERDILQEVKDSLKPKEAALILAIRNKYQYGEITIITRDGLPFRAKRAWEFDELEI